ncbi:DUF397 domain-containing protein [Streptomyces sp. Wb2n-11]|uniref:DUF397 domain-containing protein n=1 Tax=Streptomyces sp. Wb2n-11 TaxID=1030533 RepID=UPI00159EBD89
MPTRDWRKSSYCTQGDSCGHVASSHGTVGVTESGGPAGAPLRATPAGLDGIRAAPGGEDGPGPRIEIAFGPEDPVHLRGTGDPENVPRRTGRSGTRSCSAYEPSSSTTPPGSAPRPPDHPDR